MTITIIEAIAQDLESAAGFLGHFLTTTEADRLNWKPKAEGCDSKTRSAMELVSECTYVNLRTAAALRGEAYAGELPVFGSAEEARDALVASAKVCADEIRNQDESVFDRKFQMPWGEVDGNFLLGITRANMHYHNGQINYIQCLYGDDVFHVPGR